jgi:lipoprotein signal peptidase
MRTAALIAAVFVLLFLSRSELRRTVPWELAVLLGGAIGLISFLILRRRRD